MRGHSSYVNSVCFTVDQQHVISSSSDGTIRVWDVASTDCLTTISPAKAAESFADISIMLAVPMILNPELIFVVAKLNTAYVDAICCFNLGDVIIGSNCVQYEDRSR